jgi:hypothetical protein
MIVPVLYFLPFFVHPRFCPVGFGKPLDAKFFGATNFIREFSITSIFVDK